MATEEIPADSTFWDRIKKKCDGVTYADVLKPAITTIISGVLGGGIAPFWFTKSPDLVYKIADPAIFQGEKAKIGVLVATVSNTGGKAVEKIDGSFELKDTNIQEVEIVPKELNVSHTRADDLISFKIPYLNVSESCQISVLVGNPKKLAPPYSFVVRALDVNGRKVTGNDESIWAYVFRLISGGCVGIILGQIISYFSGIGPYQISKKAMGNMKTMEGVMVQMREVMEKQNKSIEDQSKTIDLLKTKLKNDF